MCAMGIHSRRFCTSALVLGPVLVAGMICGATATSAQQSGTALLDSDRYRLQPGDKIGFDILTDADQATVLPIGADGRILAPLLGDFGIANMTLAEARDALKAEYASAGLLISPRIGVTLAAFRDLYVTGDVARPGMFPFQIDMSVEQAVALAGGVSTVIDSVEGALLQRAKLEADLAETSTRIAREAVWVARLRAQIDGRPTVDVADLPAEAVADRVLVNELVPVEQRLLNEETDALAKLREANEYELEQSERELALLSERLAKQTASIEFSRQEVERARTLVERGLRAAADINATERQLISEEGIYLGILAQISQARTRISSLRSATVQSDSASRREALQLLQERGTALRSLLSTRRGISDQLLLLTLTATDDAVAPATRFQLRRRDADGSRLIEAAAMTPVLPGDVLIVLIQPTKPAG